jgi:hypothetical protein
MKASKLLTKEQRQQQYGEYIALNLRKHGITFEQFLIRIININTL